MSRSLDCLRFSYGSARHCRRGSKTAGCGGSERLRPTSTHLGARLKPGNELPAVQLWEHSRQTENAAASAVSQPVRPVSSECSLPPGLVSTSQRPRDGSGHLAAWGNPPPSL